MGKQLKKVGFNPEFVIPKNYDGYDFLAKCEAGFFFTASKAPTFDFFLLDEEKEYEDMMKERMDAESFFIISRAMNPKNSLF